MQQDKALFFHLMHSNPEFFEFPELFGEKFVKATQIYLKIFGNDKQSGRSVFNLSAKNKSNNLINILKTWNISKRNLKIENEIELKLYNNYLLYSKKIEDGIKNFFGFKLPKKVYILINHTQFSGGSGFWFKDKNIVIILNIDFYRTHYVSVMIHEILHALLDEHKLNLLSNSFDKTKEEALLDYFSPDGVLDYYCGILKNFDLKKHYENQIFLRPDSKNAAKELFPYIQNYIKYNFGKKTVLQVLRENKVIE